MATFLKDPKDDLVLELAVQSEAEYIITLNKKDFEGIQQFGIKSMTPQEFLDMIGERSTISIRIPNSLHRALKKMAELDGVSMNQFIASAVAEKISAFATKEYLEERAKGEAGKKLNEQCPGFPQ